nr:unnamed protein product [Callosobruchus chinensis]
MTLVQTNENENIGPLNTLKYITENNIEDAFPNLVIFLRILLTLPISVASGERSFSKLKTIENSLKSSMSQERLTGLALISIEPEITMNYDKIINVFSESGFYFMPA